MIIDYKPHFHFRMFELKLSSNQIDIYFSVNAQIFCFKSNIFRPFPAQVLKASSRNGFRMVSVVVLGVLSGSYLHQLRDHQLDRLGLHSDAAL